MVGAAGIDWAAAAQASASVRKKARMRLSAILPSDAAKAGLVFRLQGKGPRGSDAFVFRENPVSVGEQHAASGKERSDNITMQKGYYELRRP